MDIRLRAALITGGFPFVHTVLRGAEIARRAGTTLEPSWGEPAHVNRELAADRFVKDGTSTHLWLLDERIVPPEDVIERLLAVDAPVATASYPWVIDDAVVANVVGHRDATWRRSVPGRVFPVRRCRLGCVLVRRDALERVTRPWFHAGASPAGAYVTDDEWFCERVRAAGLQVLCDGRVACAHVRHGLDMLQLAGSGFVDAPTAGTAP